MKPEISLVIATFNRARPLHKLFNSLKDQTLAKNKWEIIVAVDGSHDETQQILEEWSVENSLPLTWFYQKNAGQGVARHNAILKSTSEKIIVIDDDMKLCPAFIESHLKALDDDDGKTVVFGKVVPTGNCEKRPLYELVLEYKNTVMHNNFEKGLLKPTGIDLITQNVSFYKRFYLAVGGFNPKMRRGQDTFLGIQFEKAGGKFIFCKEAWAVHESNIGSYETWLRRQYDYGKFAWLAWKIDNENVDINPIKDFCDGSKLNKWVAILFVRSDVLTNMMVSVFRWCGVFLRKINLITPAIATHKAINALKQNQGLKDALGSWSAFRKAEKDYKSRIDR